MKDGKVAHQGTLQDIVDEVPDLYSEYQQAVKTATESETETEEITSRLSDDERKEFFKRKMSRELSIESSKAKREKFGPGGIHSKPIKYCTREEVKQSM